uniref:Protein RALF-like 34 n=8 Tax=Gossypium TaxID=3633 RepID=A0A0D2R0M7_GOSRA|nr:hypothetical protein B456_010G020800 [Gossypium raimondii]
MASLFLKLLLLITTMLLGTVNSQLDRTTYQLMTEDELEWPWMMSGTEEGSNGIDRRSLYRKHIRYYISYGALSANRIPCPPRSGRSYYTPDCFKARKAVNPYTRGCSRITRCRRLLKSMLYGFLYSHYLYQTKVVFAILFYISVFFHEVALDVKNLQIKIQTTFLSNLRH